MKPKLIHMLWLLIALPTGIALGSPAGELDPAFGNHGRILLSDPPFEDIAGVGIFVEPGSGRLLVVAGGWGSGGTRLLRFNNDGSLDSGFGDQGSVQLGGTDLNIYSVEWLADGSQLLGGLADYNSSALLARMRADGTPDLSFGSEGRAVLELGGDYESVSEILVQADGRIVVLGYTNRTGIGERVLARFTRDGILDSSFGISAAPGVSVIDVQGIDAQLEAIVQQGDGKFLICGSAASGPANSGPDNIVAIRILPDGSPDPGFGNNGMLLIYGLQDSITVNACQVLADGHALFVGSSGRDEQQRRATAWRVTPDGRLDSGFGADGAMVMDTSTLSGATAMLIMADGSVAIAGSQWKPSNSWQQDNNPQLSWADMMIARFDPTSGEIDQGFGNRGVTAVDFGTRFLASNAYAARLEQQPDGKLLVVGAQVDMYDWYPMSSIAIARVDPYGSGSNGWASLIDSQLGAPAKGGEVELHLRRTGGVTGQLTVDYRTVANTAIAGQDYVDTSGTVTWLDGDANDKIVSITVLNSGQPVRGKYFHVELSNSSGGLGMNQATITIPRVGSTGGGGGGGNPPDGAGATSGGGGAIGIELWLLMVPGVFRAARRSCQSGNRR
jgi:uncharacterized delta-60 repeat protein